MLTCNNAKVGHHAKIITMHVHNMCTFTCVTRNFTCIALSCA